MNKITKIYRAASIFNKLAQYSKQEGDVYRDILLALGFKIDSRTSEPTERSRIMWFEKNVTPWVIEESKGRGPNDRYGVMIMAKPGDVQIVGTVNGNKGKVSDNHFGKWSSAATNATNYSFEAFNQILYGEMALE